MSRGVVLIAVFAVLFAACGGSRTGVNQVPDQFAPDAPAGDTVAGAAQFEAVGSEVGDGGADTGGPALDVMKLADVCAPVCAGLECGPDGCGGECGACPEAAPLCEEGKCKMVCAPDCTDKECGDDGCKGSCGDCPDPHFHCIEGGCICIPSCAGKECGNDGCGGSCGGCCEGQQCVQGLCQWPNGECDDGNCVDWDGCTNGLITEFRISPAETFYMHGGHVATLQNGVHVVVWEATDYDGDDYGIVARLLDSDWFGIGNEFVVNTHFFKNQDDADVVSLLSGGFVVVWKSDEQDGSETGVFGQSFSNDGVKVGPEFQANTTTDGYQNSPGVVPSADGGFVVVWDSNGLDGNGSGVGAQRFGPDGQKAGDELVVNTYPGGNQRSPDAARLTDGRLLAVWQSCVSDSAVSSCDIRLQKFTSGLEPDGVEHLVNSWTGMQSRAHVAALDQSRSVVAWLRTSGEFTYEKDVFAQMLDSGGSKLGDEFKVNTAPAWGSGWYHRLLVAGNPEGDFVVAWTGQGEGDPVGVYARRYDASGAANGPPFRANTCTLNDQEAQGLEVFEDGSFIITWASSAQDACGQGVYGQRFAADGTKVYH